MARLWAGQMRVYLDETVRTGPFAISAIVEVSVICSGRRRLTAFGSKRPIAILIRRNGMTVALGVDGASIPTEDIERRFPGSTAEFERMAEAPSLA